MALNVQNVGDNPFQPGVSAESYIPDQLIAGDFKLVTTDVTLLSGQNLARGTVLGFITLGAAASAAKAGGNTGTGTFVPDGVTPVLANAKVGVYTLRIITAAANGGTARLVGPTGDVLGDFIITGGAGGSVTVQDQIKGVLTDGGTDFIVGDGFDITVAAGSGKAIKSVKTATDGSQVPCAILADDCNATAQDTNIGVYETGEFNGNKLIYDNSWTLAALTTALRVFSIFVKPAVSAADPT